MAEVRPPDVGSQSRPQDTGYASGANNTGRGWGGMALPRTSLHEGSTSPPSPSPAPA